MRHETVPEVASLPLGRPANRASCAPPGLMKKRPRGEPRGLKPGSLLRERGKRTRDQGAGGVTKRAAS